LKPVSTILVVDDTASNLDLLVELLGDYEVSVSLDGVTAMEIARSQKIDLVLLDIMMPDPDGFSVCAALKADPQTCDIPVIFITAKTDENSIELAYDAGGDDYVTKPFKPREVLARVKLQLERADHLKQLDFLASRDPLTGIYNRRKFFELAQRCFERGEEPEIIGAIIDIDHFKQINDTYGHPAGDEVLRGVSATLSAQLPPSVIFGRIGGEEFGLVGRFGDREDARALFERCRRAIEALEVAYGGNVIRCTISNGMACRNERFDTLDKLLSEADRALYDAKGGGRNRLIVRT
jgi:diguanylate cyclase (GGDEF)-like protein